MYAEKKVLKVNEENDDNNTIKNNYTRLLETNEFTLIMLTVTINIMMITVIMVIILIIIIGVIVMTIAQPISMVTKVEQNQHTGPISSTYKNNRYLNKHKGYAIIDLE